MTTFHLQCAVFTWDVYRRRQSSDVCHVIKLPHIHSELQVTRELQLLGRKCLWITTADRWPPTGSRTDEIVFSALFSIIFVNISGTAFCKSDIQVTAEFPLWTAQYSQQMYYREFQGNRQKIALVRQNDTWAESWKSSISLSLACRRAKASTTSSVHPQLYRPSLTCTYYRFPKRSTKADMWPNTCRGGGCSKQ